MNYDRFDQFEDYTDNDLPDDKRKELERQLATDATLRTELNEYHQFRHSLESVSLKQQLEQLHNRLDQQGALDNRPLPTPSVRPRQLRSAWMRAAAVVLMITGFGLYWLTRTTSAEKIFLAYYKPEPIARGINNCDLELTSGLRAYRAGNYQQALTDFEKLPVDQPCVRYYRGLSQLAIMNVQTAIIELEQAVVKRPAVSDLTLQKAEWYLALAYLKANRLDDARRQLRGITHQTEHPFQREAQKALIACEHT